MEWQIELPAFCFLETWASYLCSYEDASGLVIPDNDQISMLKKAILSNTALHSITTNSTMIQAALIVHGLSKKSMSYSIFTRLSRIMQNCWITTPHCSNRASNVPIRLPEVRLRRQKRISQKLPIMTIGLLKRIIFIGRQKASSTNCHGTNKKLCATKLSNGCATSKRRTNRQRRKQRYADNDVSTCPFGFACKLQQCATCHIGS